MLFKILFIRCPSVTFMKSSVFYLYIIYLLWHNVVAWMRNISVPENYGFDTIICDYLYRGWWCKLTASGIQLFMSPSPKFISPMFSSIIFTCHPFQPSTISFLRVGNTFSISFTFDVTKLQKIILMSHRLPAFHSQ